MNLFDDSAQTNLASLIVLYFKIRGYKVPSVDDALKWHATEVGEACEVILADNGYVRNNPDDHPPYSPEKFGEELGDAIMMLIVAGLTAGVDPVACLIEKMGRKTNSEIFKIEAIR